MTDTTRSLRGQTMSRISASPADEEPNTATDERLLHAYVGHGSRPAFDRIVARHRPLVYAACRRELGDAALAEDVTQAVFLVLARKARELRPGTILAGWLFGTARLACRNALRREGTRWRQEQALVEEHVQTARSGPKPDPWDEIEPLLNGELASLGRPDREALLLRFFEGLSFAQTGAALHISEDAARMRVGRALDRLRRRLARAGVVIGAAALAALLSERAAPAAPVSSLPDAHDLRVEILTKGTLKDMLLLQITRIALVAASLGLVGGGGLVAHVRLAHIQPLTRPQAQAQNAAPSPTVPQPTHGVPVLGGIQAQYDRLATAYRQGGSGLTAAQKAIFAPGYTTQGTLPGFAQKPAAISPGWTIQTYTLTVHGLTANGATGTVVAVVKMQAHSVQLTPPDAQGRRHTVTADAQDSDTWVLDGGDTWRLKAIHMLSRRATYDGKPIGAGQ